MDLSRVPGIFAICRLAPDNAIPAWVWHDRSFLSITYTADELSIICPLAHVPAGVPAERHWAILKVEGSLELDLTDVLSSLTTPLTTAGLALFVVSTFDTDYFLVKEQHLTQARQILEGAGHHFI